MRAEAKIKVRQPLNSLTYSWDVLGDMYQTIIAEEVNVKAVKHGQKLALDTKLTPELTDEGTAREIIHFVNKARKSAGLSVEDRIKLSLIGDVPKDFIDLIKAETLAIELTEKNYAYDTIATVNGKSLTISLEKA